MTPKDESPRLEGVKWQPTPLFLPGEIPGTEEPGGLPSMGSHSAPPPRVSCLPLPHPSAWQTPSLNTLLRLRSSVTSSMRPSLTPFPRKSRLPCSWESTTGLCIATPYAGILSQSMKHEAHGHAMWMALSLRSGTMSSHLTIPCT